MENDRLWIKCKNCKEKRLLIKYYPSFSYICEDNILGDWLLRHSKCSNSYYYDDNCFETFIENAKENEDD